MSETRRSGAGQGSSRGSQLDKQRAVLAARNPKDSKFGECLINTNTKPDFVLTSRLSKITAERKRMELKMQQLEQHFVKTTLCLRYEPLILVERPASPQVRQRALSIQYSGLDPEDQHKPGYMRQLQSRCRTPSTLTTIDAFTVQVRKKRNVWEAAMDQKEPPRFRSTVRPSARLTGQEKVTLERGWDVHKPKVASQQPQRDVTSARTPFLTQLPRAALARTPDGRFLQSVTLDRLLVIKTPRPSTSTGCRPLEQRQPKVAISETPLIHPLVS